MQANPGSVREEATRQARARLGSAGHPPKFLIEMPPRRRELLDNLRETVLRRRRPEMSWLTSKPAAFWGDVFVPRGLPWGAIRQSYLYHAFVVVAIWGLSVTYLQRPRIEPGNPFEHTTVVYYSVEDYLPVLETDDAQEEKPPQAPERKRPEQKGEPKYARQRIISLPPAPDNFRQTVVTPSKIKLPQEAALPNLVAWNPPAKPDAPPEAAKPRLVLPAAQAAVMPRPPEIERAQAGKLTAELVGKAVEPPKLTQEVPLQTAALNAAPPAAVQAAIEADLAKRRLGALSVGAIPLTAAAPQAVVERLTTPLRPRSAEKPAAGSAAGETSAPSLPGGSAPGDAEGGVGRLIALGLNPSLPKGPIEVPKGSRSGEFAAGPEGKPEARGTPEIKAGVNGEGGNGEHAGLPSGLSISAGPQQNAAKANAPVIVASAPTIPRIPQRTARPATSVTEPARIEDRVFAGKRYYSLTLNMPNLASAGGSWIIRFAELEEKPGAGELTAPVATRKVDPAYPAEAQRDLVEGTVTLYAVIHKDGSVGEVKVLRGVDERLDQNACRALLGWRFRPATRDGNPVELEAVVQIPFRTRKEPF